MVDRFVFFIVVFTCVFVRLSVCAPAFVFLILPVIICLPTITPCMS